MGSALEFFKTSLGDSNVQTILRTLTTQKVELQGTFYIIHFYSVWTFCQILHCCCCLVTKSFATPWTVACQAPLFMGFPRQEYWGGLPLPSPGDLPNQGIKPTVSCIGRQVFFCFFFFNTEPSGKPKYYITLDLKKKSELEEQWGGEGKRRKTRRKRGGEKE